MGDFMVDMCVLGGKPLESLNMYNAPYFVSTDICFFVQTDRAAMLDEIVDYVKFLRLQVKVSLTLLTFLTS